MSPIISVLAVWLSLSLLTAVEPTPDDVDEHYYHIPSEDIDKVVYTFAEDEAINKEEKEELFQPIKDLTSYIIGGGRDIKVMKHGYQLSPSGYQNRQSLLDVMDKIKRLIKESQNKHFKG